MTLHLAAPFVHSQRRYESEIIGFPSYAAGEALGDKGWLQFVQHVSREPLLAVAVLTQALRYPGKFGPCTAGTIAYLPMVENHSPNPVFFQQSSEGLGGARHDGRNTSLGGDAVVGERPEGVQPLLD